MGPGTPTNNVWLKAMVPKFIYFQSHGRHCLHVWILCKTIKEM